ncbi:mRNA triphosphatase Cet1-like protein [Gracilaria domingensis]|nr:mRNA triphosphatase Cet1-like protein [Gracilaria domingensis]
MVYDPFAAKADNTENAPVRKLVSVRRPKICDAQLSSLDWGAPETRKRTRTEANLPNEQHPIRSAPAPARPTQQTKSTDQSEKRETIRCVEKIVYAEPTTILGVPPVVDDRIRHVVDFILNHVKSDKVEIEVKLGVLFEKQNDVRAINVVPVKCETSISPENNHETRFESNVGESVFYTLNNALNKRVELTERETKNKVQYTRTRHLDVYWPGRIRETKQMRENPDGSESYETIRVQSKTRLGDMNVMCPMNLLDMRYSASLEEDAEVPPNSSPIRQRMKDRISYKYEYLSIDITCVTMESMGAQTEGQRTFEVEVEIDPSANLFQEVTKYLQGDGTSKLFDIATCLVNTVRILQEAKHN